MKMIALAASVLVMVGCSESEKMYESPLSGEKYTLEEVAAIDNCVLTETNFMAVAFREDDSMAAKVSLSMLCEGLILGQRPIDTNN